MNNEKMFIYLAQRRHQTNKSTSLLLQTNKQTNKNQACMGAASLTRKKKTQFLHVHPGALAKATFHYGIKITDILKTRRTGSKE